jgi:hypothetical protein
VGWETDEELETAWLGGYGSEEEEEAEQFLTACLAGDHGEDVRVDAESMGARLQDYMAQDLPMGDQLAQELAAQADEESIELSEAEQREVARAREDEGTAVLTAVVEELADQKGRRDPGRAERGESAELTPGEVAKVVDRVGLDVLEGRPPAPDVLRDLAAELFDHSDGNVYQERAIERANAITGGDEPSARIEVGEVGTRDAAEADRLERGLQAHAAARQTDPRASRAERLQAAHEAVLAVAGGDEEGEIE